MIRGPRRASQARVRDADGADRMGYTRRAMTPAVSLSRLRSHIEALARFGKNAEGQGITRICWSPAYEEARAWLLGRMRAAGLRTSIDAAGNTFGTLGEGRPVVLTG